MRESTNHLVATGKRFAAPVAVAGGFVLGVALFAGHWHAFAESAGGMLAGGAPVDEQSVSALTSLDQAMEAVTSRVTPAVVNVAVTAKVSAEEAAQEGQGDDDGGQQQQIPPGLRRFFGGMGGQQPQGPQIEHGIGSGVIISPDGYIVTNNHVVNNATQVKVTLHDRRVLNAKVVGVDKLTDLAVIKVDARDLPAIAWGDSTKLQPGQTVLAFGSPFGSLQFSVTRGIVSAVNRPNPYRDDARKPGAYIQTDAAINPGNSGGPLVNAHGELVGINTFIISGSGQFAGAGFAIPSQLVRATAVQLIKNGHVEHGYLGVTLNDVTPENASFFHLSDANGALIAQVTPDSPASKGGIKQGDVVKEVNGQKVADGSALQMAVSEMQPGTPLTLGIVRDGRSMTLNLTVGSFKGNSEEAANDGASQNKGRIGIALGDLNDEARQQFQIPARVKGAVIGEVRPGSPAEDAGLQPGDVIQEVNRTPVASASEAVSQIHAAPEGKDVLLLVWSHGNASYRTVHPDMQ
ncbi:MAG TPA: Do family serine endopeptidase [Terracidiphilus sp.]|jgi:serine protease Do